MENVPGYVAGTFIAVVIAVIGFLYYAINAATPDKKNITTSIVITLLLGWIFVVSLLVFDGYFTHLSGIPRLPIFVGIISSMMIACFIIPTSRNILMNMPITTLHYIHIVRVPVEMVLWWLAVSRAIPVEMTFEGRNYDIISGISAPFAAVFMVGGRSKNRIGAVIWNIISLLLLIHIIYTSVSYMPYFYTPTIDKVANLGMFYFPYILLPTFIVPAVIFSHLASLMQLIFKKDQLQF